MFDYSFHLLQHTCCVAIRIKLHRVSSSFVVRILLHIPHSVLKVSGNREGWVTFLIIPIRKSLCSKKSAITGR
jgi:hypothetical protein